MLALPVGVLLQSLEGHSSLVTEVFGDFHTSISKWEDRAMHCVQTCVTLNKIPALYFRWLKCIVVDSTKI